MTEIEAKGKWCPMTRHQNGSGGVGVNRVNWDKTYNYANCIGSACMMWRGTNTNPDGTLIAKFDGDNPVPEGYCGLAGKP